MQFFRFTLRLIALLFSVFLVLPLVVILILVFQKTENRKMNKWVINSWSNLLCYICGLKVINKGRIHSNPVLLVANHVTWLDIPVIHSRKLAGFVAKKEIASWPLLGLAVKSGETLFIARGQKESRQKVLQSIKKRLQQGRSIALFPEGKATDGTYLGRFHRPLMQAAIEVEKPIQAIAIKYLKRDGTRNDEICFIEDEKFVSNVFRILSLPRSTVELNFCETIDTKNKSAREVALLTHQQVSKELARHDYL